MIALLESVFLDADFFFSPFSTCNISCHSLLGCKISTEKSASSLMGFPLYLTVFFCCFKNSAYHYFFAFLITVCWCGPPWVDFFLGGRDLCTSWIWIVASFHRFGNFLGINSSNNFFTSFISSSRIGVMLMFLCLME